MQIRIFVTQMKNEPLVKTARISIRLILLLAGILSCQMAVAQTVKYSNEFLSIGVGARQLAMGGAASATTADVYAGYWNPAGLTSIENNIQLAGMHNSYFAGLGSYNYLALATRMSDSSRLAFSYLRFGIDDIPNTLELIDASGNIRYDRVSVFSAIDNAFLISFARITRIPNLSLGANAKIIYRKAGDFAQAFGFGFDLGATYSLKNWQIAAVLHDATSTFNSWTFATEEFAEVFALTGNEIPEASTEITMPRLSLAGGRNFKLNEKAGLLIELDFDITFDGKRNTIIRTDMASADPKIAVEFDFKKLFYLRAGVSNMQSVNDENGKKRFDFQPSIGLGLQLQKLAVDYAFTDMGDQSIALYSNVFSLRLSIDPKE